MKTKGLLLFLTAAALSIGIYAAGISSSVQADRDFETFLNHFTNSAAFQYSRVKFPLKTPISLMSDDGTTEKKYPFTKEKWPLLTKEILKVSRTVSEGGGVYISKFTVDTPTHKVFEAGYEDSDIDVHVVFDLINGQWFVTDCFIGWYSYDMSAGELREAIRQVQKQNQTFINAHP
jgi:hypothetical protein